MNPTTEPRPDATSTERSPPFRCVVCGHADPVFQARAHGRARGNTARFMGQTFRLWKCSECLSLHSVDDVDFADIYREYPLARRKLDVFARGTFANLLGRLVRAGLQKHHAILDFGCGNGIFVEYLKDRGYTDVSGYDPFVVEHAELDRTRRFDCVIANDVIEHAADPLALAIECRERCVRGGIVYIGTADAEPVEMDDLEPQLMRLHQPFHRVLLTEAGLRRVAQKAGFELIRGYRRSYMDTLLPFSNYRFLDEFNKAHGHHVDRAFDDDAGGIVFRQPRLLWFAFFGYFFPSAYEPAVVLRNPSPDPS